MQLVNRKACSLLPPEEVCFKCEVANGEGFLEKGGDAISTLLVRPQGQVLSVALVSTKGFADDHEVRAQEPHDA